MKPPVILIGPHRSGTTWLGEILKQSPELRYWPEPNHVWTWGNWFHPDDRLTAIHATPLVKRHIRSRFRRFLHRRAGLRLCEKTPSNCFRIPFIKAVFPDAKIIFLARDGRSVLNSAVKVYREDVSWGVFLETAKYMTAWDLPYLVSRAPRVLRRVRGLPVKFWGPRPPGWRTWLASDSLEEIAAKQWSSAVLHALDDLGELEARDVFRLRYEDLAQRPGRPLRELADFLDLTNPAPIVQFGEKTAKSDGVDRWRRSPPSRLLGEVRPHLEEAMAALGYAW